MTQRRQHMGNELVIFPKTMRPTALFLVCGIAVSACGTDLAVVASNDPAASSPQVSAPPQHNAAATGSGNSESAPASNQSQAAENPNAAQENATPAPVPSVFTATPAPTLSASPTPSPSVTAVPTAVPTVPATPTPAATEPTLPAPTTTPSPIAPEHADYPGCPTPASARALRVESDFIRLINVYRAENGLSTLIFNDKASCNERAKSCDMANGGAVNHSGASGRIQNAGLSFSGEIIAGFYGVYPVNGEAEELLNRWKSSPPHNANMLNPGHRGIAIGICFAPPELLFTVGNFGTAGFFQ